MVKKIRFVYRSDSKFFLNFVISGENENSTKEFDNIEVNAKANE